MSTVFRTQTLQERTKRAGYETSPHIGLYLACFLYLGCISFRQSSNLPLPSLFLDIAHSALTMPRPIAPPSLPPSKLTAAATGTECKAQREARIIKWERIMTAQEQQRRHNFRNTDAPHRRHTWPYAPSVVRLPPSFHLHPCCALQIHIYSPHS